MSRPRRRRRRLLEWAAGAFATWHVLCVLATGAKPVREAVAPINGWYVDGLKLGNTWGMFSKAPRSADTVIVGVRKGGELVELMSSYANQKSLRDRVVDARIRKIQGKLEQDEDRSSFGSVYLDYWCFEGRKSVPDLASVRVVVRQPERLDDDGNPDEPAEERVVLSRKCPKVAR
jgi:hypothetical protein